MNIIILGAGAIGSLFGALLSKKNNVLLIGRTLHTNAIRKRGLKIEGKTRFNQKIPAVHSIDDVMFSPDLLILTVKSYDTESAIKTARKMINKNTIVLSLQNGLDNIDKMEKFIARRQIIAGVTTHASLFSKPGLIKHTGKGKIILGELNGRKTKRIENIVNIFNEAGVETIVSVDIVKEIWIKAIINSSINPLTTIFECKNGYLLQNPILERIVERVCEESTGIANANGIKLSYIDMLEKTKEVINYTSENYSSMLQSFKKGRKTEIGSINGKIVEIGEKHNVEPMISEVLI
ncbi:MAG: ketopantoate reductase family protein, partial [Atribacterota bacterium]